MVNNPDSQSQNTWVILRWVSVIAVVHFIAMLFVFRPLVNGYDKLVEICATK